MLSWTTSDVVDITTTNEHDGLRATSTLHISNVTRDHYGVYHCTASNGERQGNNVSVSSILVVEGKNNRFVVAIAVCCNILQRSHRPLHASTSLILMLHHCNSHGVCQEILMV